MVIVSIFLPMLSLLEASIHKTWGVPLSFANISFQHYIHLFSTSDVVVRAFKNSLVLAFSTAIICIVFTF